jgi:hypothetical protein
MKMSETIAELATALSKAQGQIDAALKGSINPHFKSKYADLNALREAIREPLSVNDLSIIQLPRTAAGAVEIETMLLHKSGEFISEVLQMPYGQNTPQAIGSALSYCRRYSLSSILNLSADDDDGNAATEATKQSNAPMKEAREVAIKGSAVFAEYWKKLSNDERKSFTSDQLSELKKLTTEAKKEADGTEN